MNQTSPLALVHPEAQLGDDNVIGPFCYLGKDAIPGNRSILQNSVTISYGVRIGGDNEFFPSVSISTKPQDLKFVGENTICEIDDKNGIRENVAISRDTVSKGTTKVRNNNLPMENMHVVHDYVIGSNVIIGNSARFASEVTVDDYAIISTTVLCHQFCYIGGYVVVQDGSRSSQDIPPYTVADRRPIRYTGINIIGLRRGGFSNELIQLIHQTCRLLYSRGVLKEGVGEIRKNLNVTPEIQYIIDFVESSQRSIIR